MKKLNVKSVEELSQFINEAKTPGNLLQDAPDFDAIKQEDRKSTRLNSSHRSQSRMPSSA